MLSSLGFLLLLLQNAEGFTAFQSTRTQQPQQLFMTANTEKRRMGDLTTPEQTVYDMMHELSESGYKFRLVVVGKGAILETTSPLGPVSRVTQSPSTGKVFLNPSPICWI